MTDYAHYKHELIGGVTDTSGKVNDIENIDLRITLTIPLKRFVEEKGNNRYYALDVMLDTLAAIEVDLGLEGSQPANEDGLTPLQ